MFIVPFFKVFTRDFIGAFFGVNFLNKRFVQSVFVPFFRHFVGVYSFRDYLFDIVGYIFKHLFVHVRTAQNVQPFAVNGFTLFVHYFVVLQGVLSYTEVSAFDSPLRVLDTARKHFRLQALVVVNLEHGIKLFHSFSAEPLGKVVFERYEEYRRAGVALTT